MNKQIPTLGYYFNCKINQLNRYNMFGEIAIVGSRKDGVHNLISTLWKVKKLETFLIDFWFKSIFKSVWRVNRIVEKSYN